MSVPAPDVGPQAKKPKLDRWHRKQRSKSPEPPADLPDQEMEYVYERTSVDSLMDDTINCYEQVYLF